MVYHSLFLFIFMRDINYLLKKKYNMIHIKYFENDIDYHEFMVGNNIELPNVSFTDDENVVYYNPIEKNETLEG